MASWLRGRHHEAYEPFSGDIAPAVLDVDSARDFDIDLAIVDEGLFTAAGVRGARIRSDGTRTGRLTAAELDALGLGDLQRRLSDLAQRSVNLMIFPDVRSAKRRGLRMLSRPSP